MKEDLSPGYLCIIQIASLMDALELETTDDAVVILRVSSLRVVFFSSSHLFLLYRRPDGMLLQAHSIISSALKIPRCLLS